MGQNGIKLTSSPTYPGPNSSVTVSLDDYSVESIGATITWYVDGIELSDNQNERSITLETGSVGEKIPVRVVLSRTNAPTLSSSLTLTPTVVDVTIETNTYVPAFYAGRALPSNDSPIRAVAVVHDGTGAADTTYSYKWSMGSTVFNAGAVKGKNVFEFTPERYTQAPLIVEVFKADGSQIARKSIDLLVMDPELHFYEQSPLQGLFEREVSSPYTLIGEETTIYGEPYYINAQMQDSDANFTWKINGNPTQNDGTAPNAITLRQVGGGGEAQIGLHVITKRQIPQFVEDAFQILFN